MIKNQRCQACLTYSTSIRGICFFFSSAYVLAGKYATLVVTLTFHHWNQGYTCLLQNLGGPSVTSCFLKKAFIADTKIEKNTPLKTILFVVNN